MNIWHDISPERIQPESFYAVIEITKGSKNKYELDKETGMMRLDRILYTSTHYPANYGFIPRTYAQDGDPLDVLVICSEPIIPASLVHCTPIGVLAMIDEGALDHKILAVPVHDPVYNGYRNITDLPKHVSDELMHFFSVYKNLEDKVTAIESVQGVAEAVLVIAHDIETYKQKLREGEFHRDASFYYSTD